MRCKILIISATRATRIFGNALIADDYGEIRQSTALSDIPKGSAFSASSGAYRDVCATRRSFGVLYDPMMKSRGKLRCYKIRKWDTQTRIAPRPPYIFAMSDNALSCVSRQLHHQSPTVSRSSIAKRDFALFCVPFLRSCDGIFAG